MAKRHSRYCMSGNQATREDSISMVSPWLTSKAPSRFWNCGSRPVPRNKLRCCIYQYMVPRGSILQATREFGICLPPAETRVRQRNDSEHGPISPKAWDHRMDYTCAWPGYESLSLRGWLRAMALQPRIETAISIFGSSDTDQICLYTSSIDV